MSAGRGAFGIYIHVPFCHSRCGYCDFNTYTPAELGVPGNSGDQVGLPAPMAAYVAAVAQELTFAHRLTGDRVVDTVFFGGGTPTALPPASLCHIIAQVRQLWQVSDSLEVTVEANPDSIHPAGLAELATGGLTRVSFGLQSTSASVLRVLNRTHHHDALRALVPAAHDVGLQVSVDLIYGTPGESLAEWERSLRDVMHLAPEHISAYSLTVERGTALYQSVARNHVPNIDLDDQAMKYERAEQLLSGNGYQWYEISNWATEDRFACQHNLGYWRGGQWWGIGPGAHSYVDGYRWWNVKHPARYAQALEPEPTTVDHVARWCADAAVVDGHERIDAQAQRTEHVMLGIRLREGMAVDQFAAEAVASLVDAGLLWASPDRVGLTNSGRLLADRVTRTLLGWD